MKKYRILVIGIGLLLSGLLIRNIVNLAGVQDRITQSKEKTTEEERRQEELLRTQQRVTSDQFIEEQAREKLGLAKVDETVIVLPSEETIKNRVLSLPQEDVVRSIPPWRQWLRLFFGELSLEVNS